MGGSTGGISGVATPLNGLDYSIKCSTTDVLSHANALIYIAPPQTIYIDLHKLYNALHKLYTCTSSMQLSTKWVCSSLSGYSLLYQGLYYNPILKILDSSLV